MSRYHSYLNTAKTIISFYDGTEPLSVVLKNFFAADKKYGSKDRKEISHLCYCFFRLGKSAKNLTTEERILTGLFLVSMRPNELLGHLREEWNVDASLSVEEKEIFLSNTFPLDPGDLFVLDMVFPWAGEMSSGVNHVPFCKSFFSQPYVYVRMRPGYEKTILLRLQQKGIGYLQVNDTCLAFEPTINLQEIIEIDTEAVVQDLNSQYAGGIIHDLRNTTSVLWDCCAASGGKSIQAFDLLNDPEIYVSDVRKPILNNLQKRFEKAGVKNFRSFAADLSSEKIQLPAFMLNRKFDLVICDAPCTGSGTWARTPEQLYFFEEKKIAHYSALQRMIVKNVISHLKPGGKLLYITCSVFKAENEDIIDHITKISDLQIERMEIFKGYDKKADTLFAALLSAGK